MTWHMQTGDRVLEGFEAEFYLKILQDSFVFSLDYTDWEYLFYEQKYKSTDLS